MRQEPELSLQGFINAGEDGDYPFQATQWLRRCGFGGWNRVGAVVQRVSNGTYAIPTNYTAPMG